MIVDKNVFYLYLLIKFSAEVERYNNDDDKKFQPISGTASDNIKELNYIAAFQIIMIITIFKV